MLIRQWLIDGLGHLSTMLADEDAGIAVVVDPRRDVDAYLAEAAARDLAIGYVLETHLHNDYVSGARELAALTGATHVIGAGAELAFEHRPVRHRERLTAGALALTALETPGHTPEHVAYAVADRTRAEEPALLLTGGSLLVGAVGRTDLLGAEHAVPYARAMYRSLHDVVLRHDGGVAIYPTHGAGSLCSTGIAATPSSTIGYERRHNPMLQPSDIDTFVRVLLAGQPAVPRYFARMRPTNQAGPALLGGSVPPPHPLGPDRVHELLAGGALLVDLRDPAAHAAAHVAGSLSIPAGDSFGTWLGWVVEPDRELVLVLDDPADWDDAIRQALRIGYERAIVGHLRGGIGAWRDAGLPLSSDRTLDAAALARLLSAGGPDAPLVLDVRQASEYDEGHVPGAVHLSAGDLPDRLAELPRDRRLVTICAAGHRSSVAASLLRRAGFTDVAAVTGGVDAWRASRLPVEAGDGDAPPDADSLADAARH